MQVFLMLLAVYGLVFLVKYRMPFLRGTIILLDALVECPYCLGFWTGWAVWGTYRAMTDQNLFLTVSPPGAWALEGVTWGFASATFSLTLDRILEWLDVPPSKGGE